MKVLQKKAQLKIIKAEYLPHKEIISIEYEAINNSDYRGLAHSRLPSRKTNRITRIFLNSMRIADVNKVSSLTGKQVIGDIVEFTKKDGSTFIGVSATSVDFIEQMPLPVTKMVAELSVTAPKKSMVDVAASVLEELNAPTHYRELMKIMLKKKLITSNGKTPEATLGANMGIEIKRKGDSSRFVRLDDGIYALNNKLYPKFNVVTPSVIVQAPEPDTFIPYTDYPSFAQSNSLWGKIKHAISSRIFI